MFLNTSSFSNNFRFHFIADKKGVNVFTVQTVKTSVGHSPSPSQIAMNQIRINYLMIIIALQFVRGCSRVQMRLIVLIRLDLLLGRHHGLS